MIRAVTAGQPDGEYVQQRDAALLGRRIGWNASSTCPVPNACALAIFQKFDDSAELSNIVVLAMRFDWTDVNFFEQRDLQNYI